VVSGHQGWTKRRWWRARKGVEALGRCKLTRNKDHAGLKPSIGVGRIGKERGEGGRRLCVEKEDWRGAGYDGRGPSRAVRY
jgi:hypothetical protein